MLRVRRLDLWTCTLAFSSLGEVLGLNTGLAVESGWRLVTCLGAVQLAYVPAWRQLLRVERGGQGATTRVFGLSIWSFKFGCCRSS